MVQNHLILVIQAEENHMLLLSVDGQNHNITNVDGVQRAFNIYVVTYKCYLLLDWNV